MKINKAFQLAYQYYQAGDLNQAGNIYKKILRVTTKQYRCASFSWNDMLSAWGF